MIAEYRHRFHFFQREVTDLGRLVTQPQFTADNFRFEGQRDNEDFIPIGINDELIRIAVYADQTLHADVEACLFPHLADTRLRRALARIHCAAGQAPLTVIRSAREQDALVFVEDDGCAPEAQFSLFAEAVAVEDLGHN